MPSASGQAARRLRANVRAVLAGLLLLLAGGCSVAHRVDVVPGAPRRGVCLDGYPVRLLLDVRCQDGICGYTCAPDRWSRAPCP